MFVAGWERLKSNDSPGSSHVLLLIIISWGKGWSPPDLSVCHLWEWARHLILLPFIAYFMIRIRSYRVGYWHCNRCIRFLLLSLSSPRLSVILGQFWTPFNSCSCSQWAVAVFKDAKLFLFSPVYSGGSLSASLFLGQWLNAVQDMMSGSVWAGRWEALLEGSKQNH